MSSTTGGTARAFVRVDLAYSLCGPYGRVSPNTQSKTWFFDVPAAREADAAWAELLHRIFYDSNVRLGRAEPGDVNYLNLETFERSPVDVGGMLADGGASWGAMPWFATARDVVWEPAGCYIVDDEGRYDVMSGSDYTELVMNRLLGAGRVDEATFVAFFDRVAGLAGKAPVGRKYFDEREARFARIAVVRPTGQYRRAVGEEPVRSGPVDRALIDG